MRTFDVKPHDGVGRIVFGMTHDQVDAAVGEKPSARKGEKTNYYFKNRLAVFFGENGAEYIELSDGKELFVTVYRGTRVFDIEAEPLIELVARDCACESREDGHTFILPSLDVSFWRPVRPSGPNDPEGRFFKTVGVGRRGYFSA